MTATEEARLAAEGNSLVGGPLRATTSRLRSSTRTFGRVCAGGAHGVPTTLDTRRAVPLQC